jgi:NADH:ubiquinone oxidoreductase subunit E
MRTDHIFDELRRIQDQHGFLPGGKLEALSQSTGIPLYLLHGVADFYPDFHLSPPPKVNLRVCSDMACHLRGADPLRADLKQRFHSINEQDLSEREVSCLGQCDGAPAISINDRVYRNVNRALAEALVLMALGGSPLLESFRRCRSRPGRPVFPLIRTCKSNSTGLSAD